MEIYGKNWKKVETYVGTRTSAQIRSHAQKYYNKINKTAGERAATTVEAKANKESETVTHPVVELNVDLKEKINMHMEIVASLQETLSELKCSPDDPLRDVKLNRSEELLRIISDDANKTLGLTRTFPELRGPWEILAERIKTVDRTLDELCPQLRGRSSFRYLAEMLYGCAKGRSKHGVPRFCQVPARLAKLSDWTTSSASRTSSNFEV